MKQLRSRFRLISLLLVCAFLLTLAFCTGTALKTAGITLCSLPALPGIGAAGCPATPRPTPSTVGAMAMGWTWPLPQATLHT